MSTIFKVKWCVKPDHKILWNKFFLKIPLYVLVFLISQQKRANHSRNLWCAVLASKHSYPKQSSEKKVNNNVWKTSLWRSDLEGASKDTAKGKRYWKLCAGDLPFPPPQWVRDGEMVLIHHCGSRAERKGENQWLCSLWVNYLPREGFTRREGRHGVVKEMGNRKKAGKKNSGKFPLKFSSSIRNGQHQG